MQQALDYLQQLKNYHWLVGDRTAEFQQIATESYMQINQEIPPKIILAEPDPVCFLAKFLAACAAKCPVFLCNHDWGEQEWQQVWDLVQPDLVWGLSPLPQTQKSPSPIPNWIMIPTGGSSGQIKFTIHTWETLTASVQGFREYFQLQQINCFCVLPVYHVSGLMQFMRCLTTGGQLVISQFKAVVAGQIPSLNYSEFFLSLVPTQLQSLLQNPELTRWLCQFPTVLLGGAPAGRELLAAGRHHGIRLAPTYGMTETASQIATLKPDDFLQGNNSSGKILPHAQVRIGKSQEILIYAQSLALGYYPQTWENLDYFSVDDIGFLDVQGYLTIVGRSSDKIISGGENIYPGEIESAIRATNMVADVCVIGIPDQYWGQALTAIYVPLSNSSTSEIQTLLKEKISKFKIPKYWITLPTLPRNAQGKVNRQQLQELARELLVE